MKAASAICNEMLEPERFRIGHTKIFFRAGVLGYMEDMRDQVVTDLTCKLQGAVMGQRRRQDYQKRLNQRRLLCIIQKVFRRYLTLRHWGWFSIIQKTRPLIGMVNIEEEIQLLEDAATNAVVEFETTIAERKKFEEANAQLVEEKAALLKRIEAELADLEVAVGKAEQERSTKDHAIRSLNDEIAAKNELINKLNKEKKHIQEVNSKASEELQT